MTNGSEFWANITEFKSKKMAFMCFIFGFDVSVKKGLENNYFLINSNFSAK